MAIPAAISAEIGKFGITMNATATDIIPPQPGNTPIIAAINITKLVKISAESVLLQRAILVRFLLLNSASAR